MVIGTKKLLTLKEMESIAREATHAALQGYEAPEHRENLTLGSAITDADGVFELYIAGERPQDAKVISKAVVDRVTGDVKVEVFLKPQTSI